VLDGLFVNPVGFPKGIEHEVQLFPFRNHNTNQDKGQVEYEKYDQSHSSIALVQNKVIHGPPLITQAFNKIFRHFVTGDG